MTDMFIDRFDAIAQRRAGHAAIVTDGETGTSYAALREQALGIAAALPAGKAGRLVAIDIEKSADYLAAVLGCWYAGAAFLPLDPQLPPERRAHILREAQPVCILSRQTDDAQTINIAPLPPHKARPALTATPDTTAYVIYTSGSTGTPKGVSVSHRGLVPVLKAQIGLFQIDENTRSLFYLSTAFDASISDFGTALLAGATLYIESGDTIATAARLPALIAARGITYADLPPALLQVIAPADMPACLATICIGGEVCPPAVVRRWAGTRRIVCVYGPTEATICTSASPCDAHSWTQPLIGRPLSGVTYAIFDRALAPCDDGELYIAGPHLAQGYLAQPDLTAQKFITHNGRRWYRTGDHVRRDGEDIVFLGRIDRQFKWRGQLVEPEEIEHALIALPAISRAAVMRDASGGVEQLVAHIECAAPPDDDHLRAHLRARLPAWMIPSAIIAHARLPLTATGKINRSALTGYAAVRSQDDSLFFPATPAEEHLHAAWQRVLGRKDIPAHTAFDALGGDSFAVLQLILEAEKNGVILSPDTVTRHKTITAQARHVHAAHADTGFQSAETLRRHVLARYPVPRRNPDPGRDDAGRIFMTGATGFLGRQVLLRLLAQDTRPVDVLMRAGTPEEGWRRLALDDSLRPRLRIVCGDITQPRFGLAPALWEELSDQTQTIIHCAATVNMAMTYAQLEDANVGALHSLLELAASGRHKHIHHASTLSVFVATDRNTGTAREDDSLHATREIYGGYAQSKWAAEVLLHAARAQGYRLSCYRLGLVTGDSTSGAFSCHDFLRTFMQGLSSLGHIPAGPHDDLLVDVTPVDYAADMMCAAIHAPVDGTFHIANRGGFSFGQIIRALGRAGFALTPLTADDWQQHLAAYPSLSPAETAALMGMCRALPAPAFARHRAMDLFQATAIAFDSARLMATLGERWRVPPHADDALLDLYIRSFQLPPIRAKNLSSA